MFARIKAALKVLFAPKAVYPAPKDVPPPDLLDITEPEWRRLEDACPWKGRRAVIFWAFVNGVNWARREHWAGHECEPAQEAEVKG